MRPPIEFPTTARRADVELVEQPIEQPRIARDRDLPGGHRGVAEARQVDRDHAVIAREHGQLLEPVRASSPTGRA